MKFLTLSLPIFVGYLALKARVPSLAELVLRVPGKRHPNDRRTAELVVEALQNRGKGRLLSDYKAKITRIEQKKALSSEAGIEDILDHMARLETLRRTSLELAGKEVIRYLSSEGGREQLKIAAGNALENHPNSVFLLYLYAVSLAKGGEYVKAHELTTSALKECLRAYVESENKSEVLKSRLKGLKSVWKVIDGIARENMDWADGKNGESYDINEPAQTDGPKDDDEDPSNLSSIFTEALIQSRQQERFLIACKREFDGTDSLRGRASIVKEMMREGLRRLASYHDAYELAHASYRELRPEWLALLPGTAAYSESPESLEEMTPVSAVRQLCGVLQLARKLGYTEDVECIENALVDIAKMPIASNTIWIVAANIIEVDPHHPLCEVVSELVRNAPRDPSSELELRGYFVWALKTRQFEEAHEMYARLPGTTQYLRCMMHYVRVLQRDGQFHAAAKLTRAIHAKYFMKLHQVDATVSWELIRREQELQFADETAKWFGCFPQPTNPTGVIFIAPRTIEQLRKLPIVVLMEMKRLGWAIICLVEGVLPLEPTGDPDLDIFNGCLTVDRCLTEEAKHQLRPIKDFKADLTKGKLSWGKIDLTHTLWEDAAINRRRYNVDYTCPALEGFLTKTKLWTELTAITLENTHRVMKEKNLKAGFMVSFQARLPDVLARFYCEEFGDPKRFFCIHAANGYQNYFTNFSTPVSSKIAIRNMTRHSETRSASFPVPNEFDAFYKANRASTPAMLELYREVTKIKRSTAGQTEQLPQARICAIRIAEWKKRGGKVVCAFGKVVCDSSVPYDGGPAHENMQDWLNHTIDAVRGSNTMLLIKPHPHEKNNQIASFLTEHFEDLIKAEIPDNVIFLGHHWFDMHDMLGLIDLGLIYNGTTAVELGVLGIPAILCSHFGPIDYPLGHTTPRNRKHYEQLVRFEKPTKPPKDINERAACWLNYMSSDKVTVDYRYHARQITNKVVYPSWWFKEDIEAYFLEGDENVEKLAADLIDQTS